MRRRLRLRPDGASAVDVSRLLSLETDGGSLILGMFIVTNVAFALTTIGTLSTAWPAYVAVVVVSAAAVLLVRPHPDPFPLRDSWLVVGAVVVSSIVLSLALPAEGVIGRASWHLGSNMWLLWFLIIRGRGRLAWLGAALMTAITVGWAMAVGRGWGAGLSMLDTQLGMLVVASIFARALRRTAWRINALSERSVEAAAAAAASEATRQVRLQRASEVARLAVPFLTRIVDGGPLSADERAQVRDAEAMLRDSVRGRALATPAVLTAATRARGRGVDVVLLDDRGSGLPSGEAMQRVEARVTETLTRAAGSVTVRLLPAGRDAAVTIVAVDPERVERTLLDVDGDVITAA
ncbi:hypothetical protein [Demequina lignilytica]|uniref:Signal transduction histidine kinase n=1 Tax=Demequina lignilytica TaxID=3051663 RepID=A0AB35MHP5_9MICO|nr:hypothetical protein [Demequina sp. SYSU T0a273]MDN4483309.1 hypothetical protein [Demequina sp. SYSU T0a273]